MRLRGEAHLVLSYLNRPRPKQVPRLAPLDLKDRDRQLEGLVERDVGCGVVLCRERLGRVEEISRQAVLEGLDAVRLAASGLTVSEDEADSSRDSAPEDLRGRRALVS